MKPSARAFLVGSSLLFLLLLWFLSGLSQTKGMFLFGIGTLLLTGGLLAARRGYHRPLFLLYLTTLMLAAAVAAGEGVLRVKPDILSGALANYAYARYHTQPGGIYESDEHLGWALRPNHACDAYWNGHWWRHTTNADGYRGAAVESAHAVFLGDSLIYGHGVENEQTVPSQFHARTGLAVANLGQQATCLVQMEWRYRHLGARLCPRVVFVCSHFNDIPDALVWYPEEELKRFLAAAPHEACAIRVRSHLWPRPTPEWRVDRHVWDAYLAPRLRFPRALVGLYRAWNRGQLQRREAGLLPDDKPFTPSPEFLAAPFAPWEAAADGVNRLGWQVHCHALARIQHQCRQHGAQLVLFDLGYPHAFSQAIEELARQLEVAYSPAGRVALHRALEGEDVYLANDGHWTAHGCFIVAQELARFSDASEKRP